MNTSRDFWGQVDVKFTVGTIFSANIVIIWSRIDNDNAVIAVGDNIPIEEYKQRYLLYSLKSKYNLCFCLETVPRAACSANFSRNPSIPIYYLQYVLYTAPSQLLFVLNFLKVTVCELGPQARKNRLKQVDTEGF